MTRLGFLKSDEDPDYYRISNMKVDFVLVGFTKNLNDVEKLLTDVDYKKMRCFFVFLQSVSMRT